MLRLKFAKINKQGVLIRPGGRKKFQKSISGGTFIRHEKVFRHKLFHAKFINNSCIKIWYKIFYLFCEKVEVAIQKA